MASLCQSGVCQPGLLRPSTPVNSKKPSESTLKLNLRSGSKQNGRAVLPQSSFTGTISPFVQSGGGSGPPRVFMAAGAYICRDCGYIYNARTPFEKLSNDYSCPVCSAPKRRFKPYDAPVARNANDLAVRKERKATLKKGDSGSPLPIVIGLIILVIIGTYVYASSQY